MVKSVARKETEHMELPAASPGDTDGLTPAERYRKRHPDRVKESYKKWVVKNQDYNSARKKAWQSSDAAKAKAKQYRLDHKEHLCAKNKEWRHKNPEKMKEIAVRAKVTRPWNSYIQAARKRGLAYDLTNDQVVSLVKPLCHYCGEPGTPHVGIDRKDNDEGYIPDNVVPCCKRCNWAKGTSSYAEFVEWHQRAAKFVTEKKE